MKYRHLEGWSPDGGTRKQYNYRIVPVVDGAPRLMKPKDIEYIVKRGPLPTLAEVTDALSRRYDDLVDAGMLHPCTECDAPCERIVHEKQPTEGREYRRSTILKYQEALMGCELHPQALNTETITVEVETPSPNDVDIVAVARGYLMALDAVQGFMDEARSAMESLIRYNGAKP